MIRKALYVTMAIVVVGAAFSGVSVAHEEPTASDVVTVDSPEHITVTPLGPKTCSITTYDDTDKGSGGGGTGGGGGC